MIHAVHCMYSSFHSMLLLSPFTMLCVLCRSENVYIAAERHFHCPFTQCYDLQIVYISLCVL